MTTANANQQSWFTSYEQNEIAILKTLKHPFEMGINLEIKEAFLQPLNNSKTHPESHRSCFLTPPAC